MDEREIERLRIVDVAWLVGIKDELVELKKTLGVERKSFKSYAANSTERISTLEEHMNKVMAGVTEILQIADSLDVIRNSDEAVALLTMVRNVANSLLE